MENVIPMLFFLALFLGKVAFWIWFICTILYALAEHREEKEQEKQDMINEIVRRTKGD